MKTCTGKKITTPAGVILSCSDYLQNDLFMWFSRIWLANYLYHNHVQYSFFEMKTKALFLAGACMLIRSTSASYLLPQDIEYYSRKLGDIITLTCRYEVALQHLYIDTLPGKYGNFEFNMDIPE